MTQAVAYLTRSGELAWYRLWTDAEKARLRALFDAGRDDAAIGRALNRTPNAVRHMRMDLGLLRGRPNAERQWTPKMRADAVKLRRRGKSSSEIARYLGRGLTRNAVIGELWRLGEPGVRVNQAA